MVSAEAKGMSCALQSGVVGPRQSKEMQWRDGVLYVGRPKLQTIWADQFAYYDLDVMLYPVYSTSPRQAHLLLCAKNAAHCGICIWIRMTEQLFCGNAYHVGLSCGSRLLNNIIVCREIDATEPNIAYANGTVMNFVTTQFTGDDAQVYLCLRRHSPRESEMRLVSMQRQGCARNALLDDLYVYKFSLCWLCKQS